MQHQKMNFLKDCSIRVLDCWAWIQWDAPAGRNQEEKEPEPGVLGAWRNQACKNGSVKSELTQRLAWG